jgi:hypothetical protein
LSDENYFNKFIELSEDSVYTAPENFVLSVMNRINAKKTVKIIPLISRKLSAAVCFFSAAAVLILTFTGANGKIFDFITSSVTPDKIAKIGEFLDIILNFRLN